MLGEAPSFGGLCEALRRTGADHGSSLVLLKPGEGSPPLYLVHGIGGQAAELLVAARCMSYPGPVFGIQARGLRLRELPRLSVQAMAADYLRQIRAQLPSGALPPVWHLCGYSFGGLVAFEMACQLHRAGQMVGVLGLLDTLPRPLRWRLTGGASRLSALLAVFLSFLLKAKASAPQLPCAARPQPCCGDSPQAL